jgi:hypothetical protein
MGASIVAYFPGVTGDQVDLQEGFWNDDRAWANFMVEQEKDPKVVEAMQKLNAGALLTFKTEEMDDEDIDWVTPQELRDACMKLRDAVRSGAPEAEPLLDAYSRGNNGIDPITDEFVRDLEDIIKLADWGEKMGTNQITLEVSW